MKKQLIQFGGKGILVIILTLGLLLILNKQYEKSIMYRYSDTFKFGSIPDQVLVSNIGSSHAEYGIQYDRCPELKGSISTFNFALASQSYDYDLALLNMYQDHLAKGGILFIPISYFSFNDEVVNDVEKESMQARYYSFMSPKYIPDYSLYKDIITHRLPILSADEDLLNWITSSLSLKAHAEGSTLTQEEAIEKAEARYDRHFLHKENLFYPERTEQIKEIITFCKEREITPVMITIPVTRYYHDLISDDFFNEFYQTINAISEETSVPYYDYSYDARFRGNLSLFNDSDHLSNDGSVYFMSVIEQEIPEYYEVLKKNGVTIP